MTKESDAFAGCACFVQRHVLRLFLDDIEGGRDISLVYIPFTDAQIRQKFILYCDGCEKIEFR